MKLYKSLALGAALFGFGSVAYAQSDKCDREHQDPRVFAQERVYGESNRITDVTLYKPRVDRVLAQTTTAFNARALEKGDAVTLTFKARGAKDYTMWAEFDGVLYLCSETKSRKEPVECKVMTNSEEGSCGTDGSCIRQNTHIAQLLAEEGLSALKSVAMGIAHKVL